MNISQKGIDFIKEGEGFSATVYKDSVGLDTIGYGTLIDTVEEQYLLKAVLSENEAEVLLMKDVMPFVNTLNKIFANTILTQGQFDAICAFCYNCGMANFKSSTLLKLILANPNNPVIARLAPAKIILFGLTPLSYPDNEFMKWINGGGKKIKGLANRRLAECKLYNS